MIQSVSVMFGKKFVLLFLLSSCFGDISLNFNEAIHKVQESGASCVNLIAENFFAPSSTICIVTSGFTNLTNFQIAKTTDQLITHKLMMQSKWNMMTKVGILKHHYVSRVSCPSPPLHTNFIPAHRFR